jgi:hypothetical protein
MPVSVSYATRKRWLPPLCGDGNGDKRVQHVCVRATFARRALESIVVALAPVSHYELHYARLLGVGRSFVFPCDAAGNVEVDSLSERARENYIFARSAVGVEMSLPTVRAAPLHLSS